MTENNKHSLPEFDSLDELVDFFDSQDMGDYWETLAEVDFDVDIQRQTHLVVLEDELLENLNEIARKRHIGSAELINMWLKEKVAEQTVS